MKKSAIKNLVISSIAAVLSACGGGGSCSGCAVPSGTNSQLIFVAPSILPSLANKTGINYMGVYNPSTVAISGISYSVGQQVGSGNSVTLDADSAALCANIAAQSSCFLKLSVPEGTIAGGTVVTATNSSGAEAATPLAIGVQQVAYAESANANGVGLYLYPKAQYSESGVPFILVTAVVQSPNLGNVNTIELVDENGSIIANQVVTSGNSGAGKAVLQMGDVVEISLPLPKGANLTQNMKVQTSYQTSSVISTIANKLNLKSLASLQDTVNSNLGTTIYSVQTQSNNINLQFTPNQVYLTATNPIQYGYLYNIGDLTASQIQVSSNNPNVRVTAANEIVSGQRVIKITYELIDTTVPSSGSTVTVTAQNPSGETQTSTGNAELNVNPLPVPTQLRLTMTTNTAITAGATCSSVTVTSSSTVSSNTPVTITLDPVSSNSYGFGSSPTSGPFSNTASCTILANASSCTTSSENGLCAAAGSSGTLFTATATAINHTNGTLPISIAASNLPTLTVTTSTNLTAGACSNVTIAASSMVSSSTPVTVNIDPVSANSYGFGSGPNAGSFSSTGSCTIAAGANSCTISSGSNLCAATSATGSAFVATASSSGYNNGTLPITVAGPALTVTTSAAVTAGAECRSVTITVPAPVSAITPVTVNISPVSASSYGFGSGPNAGSFSSTFSCSIASGATSCSSGDGNNLCAASAAAGNSFTVTAAATSYSNGTLPITVANQPPSSNIFQTDTGGGYPVTGGGVSSFDTACASYATAHSIPGNYKALVATATRYVGGSDWVIQPNTRYRAIYSNGSSGFEYQDLFTSDSNGKPPVTLSNNIYGFTARGQSYAWGGFQNNEFYYDPTLTSGNSQNCTNWTSNGAGLSPKYLFTALASSQPNWSTTNASGSSDPARVNCAGTGYQQGGNMQLVCIEQPAPSPTPTPTPTPTPVTNDIPSSFTGTDCGDNMGPYTVTFDNSFNAGDVIQFISDPGFPQGVEVCSSGGNPDTCNGSSVSDDYQACTLTGSAPYQCTIYLWIYYKGAGSYSSNIKFKLNGVLDSTIVQTVGTSSLDPDQCGI